MGGHEAPVGKEQLWQNTFYNDTPYAVVMFNGDRSVGISPRQYTIQLLFDPADEESVREDFGNKIKELYEYLDNDERVSMVMFGDENQDDGDY